MNLICFLMAVILAAPVTFAAIHPRSIPRTASKHFESNGFYEGGSAVRANIEAMRFAAHSGHERWVVDFSTVDRSVGKAAPRFQLRYIPKQSLTTSMGETIISKPAKLVLLFRSIEKNYVNKQTVARLIERSDQVKDVVIYPPIDDGSTAIEFILKDNIAFTTHQPTEREGRLVIDIAQATTK